MKRLLICSLFLLGICSAAVFSVYQHQPQIPASPRQEMKLQSVHPWAPPNSLVVICKYNGQPVNAGVFIHTSASEYMTGVTFRGAKWSASGKVVFPGMAVQSSDYYHIMAGKMPSDVFDDTVSYLTNPEGNWNMSGIAEWVMLLNSTSPYITSFSSDGTVYVTLELTELSLFSPSKIDTSRSSTSITETKSTPLQTTTTTLAKKRIIRR